MDITVARSGVEIGTYQKEVVAESLANGSLLPSDYGWHEGLTEWVKLHLLFETPADPTPTPPVEPLATTRQIDFIRSFGVAIPENLTKREASDWLGKLTVDPEALLRQQALRAEEEKRKQEEHEKQQAEFAAHPSYYLKLAARDSKETLEELKTRGARHKSSIIEKKAAIKALNAELASIKNRIERLTDEIEILKEEIPELPEEIKFAKEELKNEESDRTTFWINSFKKDPPFDADAICWDLYDAAGHRFKAPSKSIVQEILGELDEENDEWDKQDMLTFYKRLEQRHPDLLKRT